MARNRRQTSSWLVLFAAFLCAGFVGVTLLVLMRGAFGVGESMLASTEDSRPVERSRVRHAPRATSEESRDESSRSATRDELGDASAATHRALDGSGTSPASSHTPPDGTSITIEGRIADVPGTPADERVLVQLLTPGRYGAIVDSRFVAPGASFRLTTAKRTGEALLACRASWLRFGPPVSVKLDTSMSGLVIPATLGARIEGRVDGLAAGDDAADLTLLLSHVVVLADSAQSNGRSRPSLVGTVQLDRERHFAFDALPTTKPFVLKGVSGAGSVPPTEPFELRPGETRFVELHFAERAFVRGRVQTEDGRPLAGATCSVRLEGSSEDEAWRTGTTGERGQFVVELDGASRATLTIARAGFESAHIDVVGDARAAPLVVHLRELQPLRGRIVWPSGIPAHGARICADDEGAAASSDETRADDEGRFELAHLSDGPFTLTASAQRIPFDDEGPDGIVSAHARFGTTVARHVTRASGDVELVLAGDLAVQGRVVDERGEPWQLVRIAARPLLRAGEPDTVRGDASREVASSFDAPDGAFELRGLYPGEWELVASFANVSSKPQRVTLGVVDARTELVFERGRRVRGYVVDASGVLLANAEVLLWTASDPREQAAMRRARSDGKGAFSFDHVAAGDVELAALTSAGGESEVVRFDGSPELSHERVELRLLGSGTIKGELVDVEGRAVGAAHVTWVPLDDDAERSASAEGKSAAAESAASNSDGARSGGTALGDASSQALSEATNARWKGRLARRYGEEAAGDDGKFTSTRLAPGNYLVRAFTDRSVSRTLVVEVRENKASRVRVVLEEGIELTARAQSRRGVRLVAIDERGHAVGTTKASWGSPDSLTRMLLPPGSYRVVGRWDDLTRTSAPIVLTAGMPQPVEVELSFQP